MGRLRLPTPERKLRKRQSQEAWKQKNWDYYCDQKRELSNRPEYRAFRRAKYLEQKQESRRCFVASVMGVSPDEVDFTRPVVGQ